MDLPDDLSEDYINIGKILMLRTLGEMKNDGVDLNEIEFDERIEEAYRNILHPDYFPRKGLVKKQKSPGIHEFKQETAEGLK